MDPSPKNEPTSTSPSDLTGFDVLAANARALIMGSLFVDIDGSDDEVQVIQPIGMAM
jgi:hypothetical protein